MAATSGTRLRVDVDFVFIGFWQFGVEQDGRSTGGPLGDRDATLPSSMFEGKSFDSRSSARRRLPSWYPGERPAGRNTPPGVGN